MRKAKMVGFRVSFEEYELLLIMAKRERRVTSEMLREIIREAAATRGLLPAGLVRFERLRGENGTSKPNN